MRVVWSSDDELGEFRRCDLDGPIGKIRLSALVIYMSAYLREYIYQISVSLNHPIEALQSIGRFIHRRMHFSVSD